MTNVESKRQGAATEVCPECRGRGWKVVADGGAGTAVRCDCAKVQRGLVLMQRAGIPERYRDCRLSNFVVRNADLEVAERLLEARQVSQRYLDSFFDVRANRFRESGLIYIGPPGTGKTHLAVAVLAEAIERYQIRGRFVDFTALLHEIQSTFDPSSLESKHAILDPVIDVELLVLDELGAQKSSEWVMDTLYLIMNSRYTAGRPTIFTTNYRLTQSAVRPAVGFETSPEGAPWSDRLAAQDQRRRETGLERGPLKVPGGRPASNPYSNLSARITPVLVSRLHEMAQPVRLDVPDFRLKKRPS